MSRSISPLLNCVSPAFYAADIADYITVLTIAVEGMAESGNLTREEVKRFQDNLDEIRESNPILASAIAERTADCAECCDVIGLQTLIMKVLLYKEATGVDAATQNMLFVR